MTKEQFLRELLWHWERMPEKSFAQLLDSSFPLSYVLGELTDEEVIESVRTFHEEFAQEQ